jgi:hypothetical protein
MGAVLFWHGDMTWLQTIGSLSRYLVLTEAPSQMDFAPLQFVCICVKAGCNIQDGRLTMSGQHQIEGYGCSPSPHLVSLEAWHIQFR